MITTEQGEEFKKLVCPLIEWLNDNLSPHASIVIDNKRAELLEGICAVYTEEFLKD